MQQEMSRVRLDELRGAPVYDNDGDKIGSVEEIFYDQQTNVPEWIGLGTGFFGTKRVLVPVQSARLYDDGLRVPYSKDHVKDAPDIDDDDVSAEAESMLRTHYSLGYAGQEATASGETVTRAEEEIEVGTRPVEAGRARLRKWVETEPVALDVELQREVARVTREQIDEPVAEHEFGEDEVEVQLRAEKPVVQKQAVAKERVGLETDVQTERETVTDELKKERVDIEGDVDRR